MKRFFMSMVVAMAAAFGVSAADTPDTVAVYGPVSIIKVATTISHNGVETDTTLLRAIFEGNTDITLEIPEDVVVSQVVIHRKFYANKPQTMVLPFAIPYGSWRAQPLKFWRYAGMLHEEGVWKFWTTGYSNDIDANTPFVVISDTDADSIEFNMAWKDGEQYGNVTMNTTDDAGTMTTDYEGWLFKGTYSRIDWEEGHPDLGCVYGFAAKTKNGVQVGQFVKAAVSDTSHPYIRPMRGYLHYNPSTILSKAAAYASTEVIATEDLPATIDIVFDDTTNSGYLGIGRMNTVTGEMTVDHWVDMRGRKLDRKPTNRGVYYNNRKKVIIK